MRRFSDSGVASVFKAYPPAVRASAHGLRDLVFDAAGGLPASANSPKP